MVQKMFFAISFFNFAKYFIVQKMFFAISLFNFAKYFLVQQCFFHRGEFNRDVKSFLKVFDC